MAKIELSEKFRNLRTETGKELLEREDVIETGTQAIVAGYHHFQLGDPGVAKSALIERFLARISGIPDGGYFHYMVDGFTKPEELFGPPNLKTLMEEHRYVREIEWALPKAYFAFLDETFKGNSSVLNAMLLLMNERKYNTDRGPAKGNLISLFGASNELPENNTLRAMFDRLHIRHWVEPLNGAKNFKKMLTAEWDPNPPPVLSLEDIFEAQKQAAQVVMPDALQDSVYDLRLKLRAENLVPSDRRWRESIAIMKAGAWIEGLGTVEERHARVLAHMLWDRDETRRQVQNMCLDLADPLERELQDFYDDLRGFEKQWRSTMATIEAEDAREAEAVEIWTRVRGIKARTAAIIDIAANEGRTMPTAEALKGSLNGLAREILNDGFNLDFFALMGELDPDD